MAKRTIQRDPELLAHQQWLGYLQPVGLVVAPAAMQDAGWVVTRSGSELIERQERYREALEALGANENGDADDRVLGFSSIETLLVDHLGWSDDQIQSAANLIEAYTRELSELGATLQPTALVPAASGEGVQLLVQELPLLTPLDQKFSGGDQHWRASSQERFERLLRETGVEAGLLFNGSQLRLVVAPKGESSGHLTFTLKDLAEVSGRLMFSGLDLLLGQSHVFLDPDGYRLVDVVNKSRSYQAVVSNALADQVLAALWDLLRGFERADQLSQQQGSSLLGDIPDTAPDQLYGGLITVLMRLVFLLYAEDEALMPSDAVYEQNYKVSSFFEKLQQDAAEFPDTMGQRFGAWTGLMSLCRLVFDGGGATADYLPARHGQLFDPELYPWLETPWISDGVALTVLSYLLIVNGERISYRALDVEQIGSVYEGIMGYEIERIKGRSLGIRSGSTQSSQSTVVIDVDALLQQSEGTRCEYLEKIIQATLPKGILGPIEAAGNIQELIEALGSRVDTDLFDSLRPSGSLALQPTLERRRSGSHYTPRSLTRPIVERALMPWVARHNGKPQSSDILKIRVCDPAMGSGAFLVESCRYLAELLESAWLCPTSGEGPPETLPTGEEPILYARRLIAQRCLYGVDKNPFAVNLAKLSLWLVSLSKTAPFTFVDHALKCGDSLIGPSITDINHFIDKSGTIQIALFNALNATNVAKRSSAFSYDSRQDTDDKQKREVLESTEKAILPLRRAGRLLLAAHFNSKSAKSYKTLCAAYSATYKDSLEDESALYNSLEIEHELVHQRRVNPFIWEAEFPEVFTGPSAGFDVIVGNPPFLGTRLISLFSSGPKYLELLKLQNPAIKGYVDLCGVFFLRALKLLGIRGSAGLIATSNISRGENKACLDEVFKAGGSIYSALPDMSWPGEANVLVSIIHFSNTTLKEMCISPTINNVRVASINSSLRCGENERKPERLVANIGKGFIGTDLGGNGFILSDQEVSKFVDNPNYSEVIWGLIGGDDVNGNPMYWKPSRYCIGFGNMRLDEAMKWPDLIEIIQDRVKPKRDNAADNGPGLHGKKYWWQHTLRRDPLYAAISELETCLAKTKVSRYHIISQCKAKNIFNNSVYVFPFDSPAVFAVLQSNIHRVWAAKYCTRRGHTVTYSIKDAFETFPFPENIEADERLIEAGMKYLELRDEASCYGKIGLTALYAGINSDEDNSGPAESMRNAIIELDQKVAEVYGFDFCLGPYSFYSDLEEEQVDVGVLDENTGNLPATFSFSPQTREMVVNGIANLNLTASLQQDTRGISFKSKGYAPSSHKSRKARSASSESESLEIPGLGSEELDND